MTPRTAVCLAATALLAATPAAEAKHKKPIVKTFEVKGTVPYPVQGGMCDVSEHGKDRHIETFKAPEAGELRVEVSEFFGDMDVVITDAKGGVLAEGNNETSTSGLTPNTGSLIETAKYKPKRAMTVQVHVCNYAASPDAKGKITFTHAR